MQPRPEVRRQDRLLDEAGQERLLETGEYGFLAMNTAIGGYGIPINFVREKTGDGADRIYFHCAPEGRKLDALAADNRASFCVVGATRVVPDKFTTAYESVIVFGRIASNLDADERRAALRLLVKKYCPEFIEKGEKYMEASFHRTHILRLDIEHRTGKTKRVMPRA
ncbi:nitroimidazol reductase NimA-like FMN-containing flavoprotein (pyridoxamine 5'-phosphate oxidase superfamily) [Ereboglobus sp. PH5-10]|uniref:pyridoxamine 5'-phosphate oxidase family protein n=1 Tax=Ereboglobus sp. PH5-10 TaxID=2940629 RepID=UPI002406B7B5|nr:pyridoxamine 5'-phosphate oxidase family protein [Ereboglobus sp. PH5-10]MDF9826326.1 nitroimidazol reductase NimA-like FMN-containing flavoprotein (pyridoxamine 5'-phosphate oxidase superfamily) [Ereboglobus sp. PH5-10]